MKSEKDRVKVSLSEEDIFKYPGKSLDEDEHQLVSDEDLLKTQSSFQKVKMSDESKNSSKLVLLFVSLIWLKVHMKIKERIGKWLMEKEDKRRK